ncbi:hypothetical protein [Pedobacter glucosidilyticus]|uniref:hypothetical protein n=1 Tax=Pedobacter glucosidilyticus TaxID=1122941 RepID=UPI0026F22212|nr:hypothetical protein [Pedobacter glucosidilyticus]
MIEVMKGFANKGTSTQPHMAKAAYLRQRRASMYDLAGNYGAARGGVKLYNSINYDQIGAQYQRGYSLFSTTDAHVVNLRGFSVSDKMNRFFGGTHKVISNVSMMNPLTGGISNGGRFMRSGSVINWIKW